MLKHFVFKILQEELIQLLLKEELMLLKIIKGMEIQHTDFFMILLKEEIIVQENQTFIDLLKFQLT